jgi:hypothetical protein
VLSWFRRHTDITAAAVLRRASHTLAVQGFYNAADSYGACQACQAGTTTQGGISTSSADCGIAPGFGYHSGSLGPCPLGVCVCVCVCVRTEWLLHPVWRLQVLLLQRHHPSLTHRLAGCTLLARLQASTTTWHGKQSSPRPAPHAPEARPPRSRAARLQQPATVSAPRALLLACSPIVAASVLWWAVLVAHSHMPLAECLPGWGGAGCASQCGSSTYGTLRSISNSTCTDCPVQATGFTFDW